MAVPTADKLAIEEWTGRFDPSTDQALYDQLGSGHLVALSVLRRRLADLTCGPAKAATEGDYSQDYSKTIDLLQAQIGQLEDVIESLGLSTNSGRIVRIRQVTVGGATIR